MDSTLVDFMNNVEPCVDPCGDCERHGALPDPAPHGAAYTRGLLGYAYWMCGNIGSRTSNTCPTNVAFTVYGTTFDGDGDCAPGVLEIIGLCSVRCLLGKCHCGP